ncbi:RING-H2 finger protein [Musa troglodytarum]|uniref:RING-H2 finger protein n=1 Tax=Musa troglodytarum TaxID=320322 RepID=A0A9E7GQB6_9LILI|nr:RING-H2 finger protein [Musa troglodytarum]
MTSSGYSPSAAMLSTLNASILGCCPTPLVLFVEGASSLTSPLTTVAVLESSFSSLAVRVPKRLHLRGENTGQVLTLVSLEMMAYGL